MFKPYHVKNVQRYPDGNSLIVIYTRSQQIFELVRDSDLPAEVTVAGSFEHRNEAILHCWTGFLCTDPEAMRELLIADIETTLEALKNAPPRTPFDDAIDDLDL